MGYLLRYHDDLSKVVEEVTAVRRILFAAAVFAFVPLCGLGCAKSGSHTAVSTAPASAPNAAAHDAVRDVEPSEPFAGVWQSCASTESLEECSRYVLLQRGRNVCGTWSYFATGDSYEGRVMAEVIAPSEARRTDICGRPGSETTTECEAGWEAIDRPLRVCDGKLGDLRGKDGSCFADYQRNEGSADALSELADQPWVQACLSRKEQEKLK